jgi:hypothetical protein
VKDHNSTIDSANAEDSAPNIQTYDLICGFNREICTASACIDVLRCVILQCHITQIVVTGVHLHQAWQRATSLLASLEATSGTRQANAREALWHSQELSRYLLTQARQLILLSV